MAEPNWKAMAARLARWWWTPYPPAQYSVRRQDGAAAGIGLVAASNPGAFNIYSRLTHLGNPESYTLQFYQKTFGVHCAAVKICETVHDGATIGEWATLLRPSDFFQLFKGDPELVQRVNWSASIAEPRSYAAFSTLWNVDAHFAGSNKTRPI